MADLTQMNFGQDSEKSAPKFSKLLSGLNPIAAGIDMASGLFSALDSVFGWSAQRQQRLQKDIMNDQQDKWKEQQQILAREQLDQWTRENEYNDPTNYYKRLLDGVDKNGLSKQAILDGSTGSVGVAGSTQMPGSTSLPGVGGSSLLPFSSTNVLASMRQRAEISNIEADSALKRAQAGESASHASLMDRQADLVVANENLVNNQALSEQSRKALLDAQTIMEQLRADNYQDITDAQLAETWERVSNLKINTENAEKEGKYIEQQAQVQLRKMESEIAVNFALRLVHIAVSKKTNTQTTGVAWDNMLKRGTTSKLIEKLEKELQYFDFDKLSTFFSNPTSLAYALADGVAYGDKGFDKQIERTLRELVDNLSN